MSNVNSPFGLLESAPIATRILADDPDQFGVPALQRGGPSVTGMSPAWAGWFNKLRLWLLLNVPTTVNPNTGSNNTAGTGAFISADPIANGAFGDGVHDDTAIIQQTINATGGVLYLRPGKIFITSAPITITGNPFVIMIYGGGGFVSTANPVMSISSQASNIFIGDIFISATSGGTCLSLTSNVNSWQIIRNCFFSSSSPAGICIALSSNNRSIQVVGCYFESNSNTGIALINQTEANIVGCEFAPGILNGITTSGTCTYNARGCNVFDNYNPPVPRALVYQSVGQSIAINTFTTLTFANTVTNFGGIWSNGNPTRFTAPVAGSYLAVGQWAANSNLTEACNLIINKNGSNTVPLAGVNQSMSTETPQQQVTGILQLAANDFVEFAVGIVGATAATTTPGQTWGSLTLLSRP